MEKVINKRVLVMGELNVDLILNQIGGLPIIGKEIMAGEMNFTLGSSSAIMASNIAAMGVDTSFCGMLGDDNFGDFIKNELRENEVDITNVKSLEQHSTGVTVVMNYEQDRANITYGGVMDLLSYQDLPRDQLQNFDHLHISSYFLQKGIQRDLPKILQAAKSAGLSTSLDLQWDPTEKWDFQYVKYLSDVDVFLPNETELLALTKSDSLESGIRAISPFINTMAVKCGRKGSVGVCRGNRLQSKAFENLKVVDAIGAGDSFNAGFIKRYLEGGTLAECLREGNLMGALNTTAPGGTNAFVNPYLIKEKLRSVWKIEL